MYRLRRGIPVLALIFCALAFAAPSRISAQQQATAPSQAPATHQSLDDAWWTGPILTAGAGTLPPGHMLLEPYFYDVRSPNSSSFGSRTYLVYGVAKRVALGVIPTFGFNKLSDGTSSSHVGLGDISLQGAYELTHFHEGGWMPTASFVLMETLPTGKYDRLGNRPSDGFGAGAYTTSLGLYLQSYVWLPNGRILRTRLDVAQAFSNTVNIQDVSVYGTGNGFRGYAKPGSSFLATASVEYSMTQRWVLATDIGYGENGSTHVRRTNVLNSNATPNTSISSSSGSNASLSFVPAIEFSWTPNLGVIFGVRQVVPSRNSIATTTPVIAINFVR